MIIKKRKKSKRNRKEQPVRRNTIGIPQITHALGTDDSCFNFSLAFETVPMPLSLVARCAPSPVCLYQRRLPGISAARPAWVPTCFSVRRGVPTARKQNRVAHGESANKGEPPRWETPPFGLPRTAAAACKPGGMRHDANDDAASPGDFTRLSCR